MRPGIRKMPHSGRRCRAPGAIATIAGVSRRVPLRHFPSLADLYAAAFDHAMSRAVEGFQPVDSKAPLASRVEMLICDRSKLFAA